MAYQSIHARPTSRRLLRLAGLIALSLLAGCSWVRSWNGDPSKLETKADPTKSTPEELYNNGIDALEQKRYVTANEQFDMVEQNYPYSSWAVNAQLMQGYAQYLQNHYTEAIGTLDRFIQL